MGAEWNKFIDSMLARIACIATGFGLWLLAVLTLLGY